MAVLQKAWSDPLQDYPGNSYEDLETPDDEPPSELEPDPADDDDDDDPQCISPEPLDFEVPEQNNNNVPLPGKEVIEEVGISSYVPYYGSPNNIKSLTRISEDEEKELEDRLAALTKELALQPLNVNIYIEESTVTVATGDKLPFEIIKTLPARIAFVDEQVLLGKKAQKNRNCSNYFNIYELIKQQQSTSHFIYLQNFCTTVCTEEILAMFFKTLRKEILRVKSATSFGSVSITTAFPCLSKEKERLKLSMKMARIKNVRVFSSTLSTAVAYAQRSHFYARKPTQRKLLFIIHYLKDSFTMSLVELEPGSILTRVSFGSWNLETCLDPDFVMNHAHMVESRDDVHYRNVQDSYVQATRHIRKYLGAGQAVDAILLVKSQREENCLDHMMTLMFGKKIHHVLVPDGPIAGATLFSSRAVAKTGLPPSLNIYENRSSNSDFEIYFNEQLLKRKPGSSSPAAGTLLKPEYTFVDSITLQKQGLIRVSEKVFEGKSIEVCNFFLDLESVQGELYEVALYEKQDEDGVYTLRVDVPKTVRGSVTRMDNLLLKISDPLLGTRLDKLTQHYEEVGAKSTKKEYYQLYFY